MAAGPFTPGGPTDLLTINPGSNTLGILAGLGGGRFANPVDIPTAEPAQVVRVADFNHDGIPDVAVLGKDTVSISWVNGREASSAVRLQQRRPRPNRAERCRLGHDGNIDLLIGNEYGDVLTLAGRATARSGRHRRRQRSLGGGGPEGQWHQGHHLRRPEPHKVVVEYGGGRRSVGDRSSGLLAPGAVAVADLNGDGIPDLIVANSGGNNVLVYPGLGNGQFGPALNGGKGFFTGTDPVGVTVANLNGRPDLVVADRGSNDLTILLNEATADGGFTFVPGPRLNLKTATQQGIGPVATAIVPSPTAALRAWRSA